MIAATIDDNYERIKGDLINRGLTYERLSDDVLDHVCCLVEDYMNQGKDFESSYKNVLDSIGEKRLPELQHQTLLNLNKKFQRMKNFTYLFGLAMAIVSIVGSFFKRMHWPGAGILITVGLGLIILVFLPLYFITNYKEQTEKKNPVYAIVGYLTLALILAGGLFKIQHWPGAGSLLVVGGGFLIVGFIPLYVVNVFHRGGKEKVVLPYIVMLLVGISVVMLYSNINMSRTLVDIYMVESLVNEDQIEMAQEKSADLIKMAKDSSYTDKLDDLNKIHDQARRLMVMVNEMQNGLISYVEEPGVAIQDLRSKDNRNAGRDAIIDSGLGRRFILQSKEYKALLDELIDDPLTRSQIRDHLEFTGEVWPYEFGPRHVLDSPLMKIYFKNTDAAIGIALSEYVAISYVMEN